MFPEAQFLITGVSGPSANAHGACLYSLRRGVISSCCHGAIVAGPNEFLHIEYVKKLTSCVASVLADHATVPAWLAGCSGDPSTKRQRKDAVFLADCC